MRRLLWFMTLVILWAILQDEVTPANLCFGMIIAGIISYLMRASPPPIPTRPLIFIKFSIYMLIQLIKSNLRIAIQVLSIKPSYYPGIIKFELATQNEDQTIWLANMISLTPGTLILDVSDDQKALYVHVMFLKDPEQAQEELKDLEKHVMELLPS